MANVYLTVFDSASEVARGDPTQFTVAIIDGANSAAIVGSVTGAGRRRLRVRIQADTKCFVGYFSTTPTVTDGTDSIPLGEENPEYVDIEQGNVLKAITRV